MGEQQERPQPRTEEERRDPGSWPGNKPGSTTGESTYGEPEADRTRPGGDDPSPDKDPADPAAGAGGDPESRRVG